MDISIFTDASKMPSTGDLAVPLPEAYPLWMEIRDFVLEKYPSAIEEWHIAVKKYGRGFRIKVKKRATIYMSPREGFFRVAMVFGQKATDQILNSEISIQIKEELMNSGVYAEGRVIRLEIHSGVVLTDIKKLVEIKIAN